MLEAFLSRQPLASASDRSRAGAKYSTPVAEQLGEYLHVDQAVLLGKGEALTSRDPHRPTRTLRSVTWQIIGIMCLLGGLPSVSKITKIAYQQVVARNDPATGWIQALRTRSREADLTWRYKQSGSDHQLVFEAMVTDRQGRAGNGSSSTKSGARMAAAQDFIRRYLPDLATQVD